MTPGMPTPDPVLQALIDQDFIPVPLTLSSDNSSALCASHKLEKCDDCKVDFVNTNRLARLLIANPNLLCPPPSNVISPKLTQAVQATKDEGNVRPCICICFLLSLKYLIQALFKRGNTSQAITRYTSAAALAIQRPPWEASQVMREELTTVVSNRSAAYCDTRDYLSALADAETVIAIRRNWNKGHLRKAKALLGLGRLRDAKDAVRLGLDFEPASQVCSQDLFWKKGK
jgi:translocation protein SEC72